MFDRIPTHLKVMAVGIGNATPTLKQDLVTTRKFGFAVGLLLALLAGYAAYTQ